MGETSILYKARVALAKSIAPRVRNPQREIWPYGDGSYSGFRLALARRLPELRLDPYGLALAAETSVWAKACIDLRKSAVSRMPWAIYDAAGNVLDNTPFHAMMKYARVAYQQNLFALWEQSLSVHGESYMEKLYNGDIPGFSIPGGLRILNTIAIEPQIQNGAIQYYQYSASGGKYKLNLSDLFIHRYASLTDDYRASAPMTTAMDAVGIKRNMQNYLRGYFDNDSTPGGIVSPKQGVSVDKNFVDRVMTNWANAFKGANNRNSTGFVSDPIDYEQFDNKLPEHQQELSDDEIAEICAAFRVPVAMVKSGGVKDPLGGGGKMDSSRQMFYEDFTEPECEDIQTFINDVIIPWLMPNSGAEFLFDFDEIRSLIKDTKERSDKVINEFNNGAITFNQLQIALDYEPVEGGDWYQFTAGKIIIQAANIGNAPALLAPSPLPPPPTAPAALPAPVENKDALQLPATVPPTGKSAAVMLHMGNHPDLIGLQNKTRAYVGETPVKWSDPTSFHVTLARMPVVTDDQIKALQTALEDIEVSDMPLKVGSLNTFDNLDSHAVHFKVRKSVDLIDLQETLHDLIASLGIPMSSFSTPEAYKPHITMGYADSKPPARTFDSHLTIKPTALHLGVGDDVVWQKPIGDVITPEPPPTPEEKKPVEDEPLPAKKSEDVIVSYSESALDELAQWEKKVKNKGVKAAFVTYTIPEHIADITRHALESADDMNIARLIFDCAKSAIELIQTPDNDDVLQMAFTAYRVAVKNYDTTRSQFVQEMLSIIGSGQADEVTRRKFAGGMRAALRRYGLIAFRDGMNSVGYDPESFNSKELSIFRSWQSEQSGYVTGLGAEVYRQGITANEVEIRANMWADVSLRSIFVQGVAAGNGSQNMKWRLGKVENHCPDCVVLDGQVHPAAEWVERDIIPGSGKTVCKQGCDCDLVNTDEPARGNWLGAAKSEDVHEHSEVI